MGRLNSVEQVCRELLHRAYLDGLIQIRGMKEKPDLPEQLQRIPSSELVGMANILNDYVGDRIGSQVVNEDGQTGWTVYSSAAAMVKLLNAAKDSGIRIEMHLECSDNPTGEER